MTESGFKDLLALFSDIHVATGLRKTGKEKSSEDA
jgi:hypothetical protein